MDAESKGWDRVKLALTPPPPLHHHTHTHKIIRYWLFRGGTFILPLFVNWYVVFYFLM